MDPWLLFKASQMTMWKEKGRRDDESGPVIPHQPHVAGKHTQPISIGKIPDADADADAKTQYRPPTNYAIQSPSRLSVCIRQSSSSSIVKVTLATCGRTGPPAGRDRLNSPNMFFIDLFLFIWGGGRRRLGDVWPLCRIANHPPQRATSKDLQAPTNRDSGVGSGLRRWLPRVAEDG